MTVEIAFRRVGLRIQGMLVEYDFKESGNSLYVMLRLPEYRGKLNTHLIPIEERALFGEKLTPHWGYHSMTGWRKRTKRISLSDKDASVSEIECRLMKELRELDIALEKINNPDWQTA